MNIEIIVPFLIAFAAVAILTPVLIPFLRKEKMGQTERTEGVKAHLKKTGTPTMGGIAILIGVTAGTVFFIPSHPAILPVLVLTLGFGAIGLLDDFLKAVSHRTEGLSAGQKIVLQLVVTTVFLILLVKTTPVGLEMVLPFTGGRTLNLGWFAFPFAYLVILATVNGANFTDGIDGLASSVTVIIAIFFTAASALNQAGVEPIGCAVTGALIAFLLYNIFPAKIFMGDTGSLALGGFVAGMAYIQRMPLFILIVGLVYAVELVSVVLQVIYFKKTHGKRLFKMTPIHHHFELSGWSEPRIVSVFTTVTILMCMVGFAAL